MEQSIRRLLGGMEFVICSRCKTAGLGVGTLCLDCRAYDKKHKVGAGAGAEVAAPHAVVVSFDLDMRARNPAVKELHAAAALRNSKELTKSRTQREKDERREKREQVRVSGDRAGPAFQKCEHARRADTCKICVGDDEATVFDRVYNSIVFT